MAMRKIPVVWATGIGGAGVSVYYSAFGVDPTVELTAFFNAIKALFPVAVTWDVPGSGDVLDETTGLITGAWTAGTAATTAATGAGSYAAGTGAYVRWQTAGIVGGRRVKGRTFLCPLVTTCFDSSGTITNANLTTIQTAANTLVGAGKLVIWHRPTSPGAADGSNHAVVGATAPDKVTSLRTRRT